MACRACLDDLAGGDRACARPPPVVLHPQEVISQFWTTFVPGPPRQVSLLPPSAKGVRRSSKERSEQQQHRRRHSKGKLAHSQPPQMRWSRSPTTHDRVGLVLLQRGLRVSALAQDGKHDLRAGCRRCEDRVESGVASGTGNRFASRSCAAQKCWSSLDLDLMACLLWPRAADAIGEAARAALLKTATPSGTHVARETGGKS